MRTKTRRMEIELGPEDMLLSNKWKYDGPKKHRATFNGWINPRSGKRYTLEAAANIEELRESL